MSRRPVPALRRLLPLLQCRGFRFPWHGGAGPWRRSDILHLGVGGSETRAPLDGPDWGPSKRSRSPDGIYGILPKHIQPYPTIISASRGAPGRGRVQLVHITPITHYGALK